MLTEFVIKWRLLSSHFEASGLFVDLRNPSVDCDRQQQSIWVPKEKSRPLSKNPKIQLCLWIASNFMSLPLMCLGEGVADLSLATWPFHRQCTVMYSLQQSWLDGAGGDKIYKSLSWTEFEHPMSRLVGWHATHCNTGRVITLSKAYKTRKQDIEKTMAYNYRLNRT